MQQLFYTYWPYMLPPLLGAIIGYVTNYIAIKMLFRPLHPWHVLGVRVPLTPGIIPSQRHELARKMGEMVGSHLLTTTDVAQTLEKPLFQQKLQQAVAGKLDNFIGQSLGPVITLLPARFHQRFYALLDMLRWKFIKSIRKHLASDTFEQKLYEFCLVHLNQFLENDLARFITPQRYQQSRDQIELLLKSWLDSDNASNSVATFIDSKTEQIFCSDKTLNQLLPVDLVDSVVAKIEDEIPAVLQQFSAMIDNQSTREDFEKKFRQGIESFIDSIEGLSAIISALFDMEKIYAKLPEFMEKGSVELQAWLQSEKVQADVRAALRQRLDSWLEQPVSSYLEQMSYEKVARLKRIIRQRSVAFIQSSNTRELLMKGLEHGIESIKDRPFADLLTSVAPDDSVDKAARLITTKLLQIAQTESLQQAFDQAMQQKISYLISERPIGELANHLPSDAREELQHGLFEQLITLLKKEIPPMVDNLDIRRIVEDKVNSLDIMKVEDLLMGIMKEQFKYINLFGALLGMLIGMLNLFLLQL